MLNQLSKTLQIFNAGTEEGTRLLDSKIKNKTYFRGYLFRDVVLRLIPKGFSILDYGCGSGRIAWLIAKEGYTVLGMDPAENLIKEAIRQDSDNLKLSFEVLKDEGETLPSDHFDAVVCSSAIEFIPDPVKVLHNFNRALKPGGRLIISFPNRRSLWRTYAKWRFGKKYDHFSVQWHVWSQREFRHLLQQTGFKPGKARYFESAFDGYTWLRWLNRFSWVGTLCCMDATSIEK
ncbi:MAG: class I SAM-dependent methyltransferase [Lewinellaceae bacterium]|nr:class I SAM-dependent methyltransferase [Lewinellaceae bacterium]